jgi:O-antigen ligase
MRNAPIVHTYVRGFIDYGILFLLIFTPLFFGSVEPWSAAIMELAAFLIFGAWIMKGITEGNIEFNSAPFIVSAAVLMVLILFQLLPLPPKIFELISPEAVKIHQMTNNGNSDEWRSISLYGEGTLDEFLKYLSYLALFIVVVNHYRTKEQVQRTCVTITVMGAFVTVMAVVQRLSSLNFYYIFFSARHMPTWGPYINHNHFAGYLEMVVPIGLGLLTYRVSRLPEGRHKSLIEHVAIIVGVERFFLLVLLLISCFFMISAVVVSLSRGGIAGLVAGLLSFFILMNSRQLLRRRSRVVVITSVIVLLLGTMAAWDRISGRLHQMEDMDNIKRLNIWSDSINVIKDFPIAGTGLGTFARIYPRYQSRYPDMRFDHAENDYIEAAVELGLPGFLLVLFTMIAYCRAVFSQWRKRHNTFIKCIAAGGLASFIALAIHGFTDFNLHIPANALLLTIIAGLTFAAVKNVSLHDGVRYG